MIRRASEYWTPQMWKSTRRLVQPGQPMPTAFPPNGFVPSGTCRGKWAITWSATITETAIVISACRRSWPWFQRRRTCWTASPKSAIAPIATSRGTTHSKVLTSLGCTEKPWPVIDCWISYAM